MSRFDCPRLRTTVAASLAALLLPTIALAETGAEDGAGSQPEVTSQEAGASDQDSGPNPAAVVFDAAILRPLGFVNLAVGAAAFVPVAVLAGPAGGLDALEQALELLVREPARSVFDRPLGDF